MEHPQTINISTSTIFRVIVILLGFAFLYLIKDILMIVFVAILITMAVNGPVNWLQKHRVPRILGVIFIYLVIALLLALVITLIFPPLAAQIKQLATNFPEFMDRIGIGLQQIQGRYRIEGNLRTVLDNVSNKLTEATSGVVATVIDIFGGLFSAVVVVVISFYLTVQERGARKFLIDLVPEEHQRYVADLIDRIQGKIGGWVRGELLLMSIIGLLTFTGLSFLGVKYALTLALIAAFLEIIPYIGPIIATVPAVILAFAQSPFLALMVILLYIVVQQLENYIIVPQIMKRTVGLNPIVIIVVMLIGAKLAGVLGIILAVPLSAAMAEFLGDFRKQKA